MQISPTTQKLKTVFLIQEWSESWCFKSLAWHRYIQPVQVNIIHCAIPTDKTLWFFYLCIELPSLYFNVLWWNASEYVLVSNPHVNYRTGDNVNIAQPCPRLTSVSTWMSLFLVSLWQCHTGPESVQHEFYQKHALVLGGRENQ